MSTTHVVFVGPERDFLMGSIALLREVGFSRIVLVTGNDPKFWRSSGAKDCKILIP